jgi:NAD(P)-dependent dehydrogenase (short-subunit alcohol dehydrogenase family)
MTETAIIIGVGAHLGLGASLARRFAAGGMHIVISGRSEDRLRARAAEMEASGGSVSVCPTDVRKEEQIAGLFDFAAQRGAAPKAVVFNPGANVRVSLAETEAWLFEHLWRVATFGAFLVAKAAAKRMVPAGGGTLLYTGASGSLRGSAMHAAFAAAKAGVRMVAQSTAREYGPRGLHVAHVIVDGAIDGDQVRKGLPELVEARGSEGLLDPDAIAEIFWQIHCQPRSAWTHEVDLRPFKEPF